MSKGALYEIVRSDPQKFQRMTSEMHFTEKKILKRELNKRAEILEGNN